LRLNANGDPVGVVMFWAFDPVEGRPARAASALGGLPTWDQTSSGILISIFKDMNMHYHPSFHSDDPAVLIFDNGNWDL